MHIEKMTELCHKRSAIYEVWNIISDHIHRDVADKIKELLKQNEVEMDEEKKKWEAKYLRKLYE